MILRNPDLSVLLGELECKAFDELSDVSDYIYKLPRFLEHEKALELRKLAIYFPNGGITADIREHYEAIKLNKTFPRLIAEGNLFSALSVFENYILLLLKVLQQNDPSASEYQPSKGVADHLRAIKIYGVEPYHTKYYEQVQAAISIRNCLMHAKGSLSTFRKADALRAQVHQYQFLSPEIRNNRGDGFTFSYCDSVSIKSDESGDRLVVMNEYSNLACFYLRE